MKINNNNDVYDYIKGNKFDDMYYFRMDSDETYMGRQSFLMEYVTNKSVLHVGFADHYSLIDQRIKNNTWMHEKLCAKANKCVGIDINKEALDYIKEKYNYTDIYEYDITSSEYLENMSTIPYDYILLPDVLEHIDNPVGFLNDIRRNDQINYKKVIITVPNALNLNNYITAHANSECINSDHMFWFTPYTLMKVLDKAGFYVEEIRMINHGEVNESSDIYPIKLNNPMLRDTIAVVCTKI